MCPVGYGMSWHCHLLPATPGNRRRAILAPRPVVVLETSSRTSYLHRKYGNWFDFASHYRYGLHKFDPWSMASSIFCNIGSCQRWSCQFQPQQAGEATISTLYSIAGWVIERACQRCINLEICCWRHCWIWILGLKHEAMATQSQDPDDDDDALARVPKEMTSGWFGSRKFAVFLESVRQILGLKGAVKMKEYTHEVTTNKRLIRRSGERSNEESTKWSIEGITERIK